MTTSIVVKNVSKVFGDAPSDAIAMIREGKTKEEILSQTGLTVGVQDVSFSVEQGEIFVVMGLSGSGKSTLLRMLNRLIPPSSGTIEAAGVDVASADPETLREVRLRNIAMVFQHFALFPHKTVAANVEFGLKVGGTPRRERTERALDALERVGLGAWAGHRTSELSGGMQQRVGLARALAVESDILLMDEPFSALDPLIRRDMQKELLVLQKELHKTIVFITHDLNEALTLGDRIAIMKDGRFVQEGTGEEIVDHPADDYVAAFTRDVERARVFSVKSIMAAPCPLNLNRDKVGDALSRMQELGRDALHVVDGDRLVGLVTYRDLTEQQVGAEDGLKQLVVRDAPTTHPETQLYQIYRSCARGLPVAVLDKHDKLIAAVSPSAVFDAIAPDGAQRSAEAGEHAIAAS